MSVNSIVIKVLSKNASFISEGIFECEVATEKSICNLIKM